MLAEGDQRLKGSAETGRGRKAEAEGPRKEMQTTGRDLEGQKPKRCALVDLGSLEHQLDDR